MMRRLISVMKVLGIGSGTLILFQQGCAIDPDIWLNAGIQFLTEVTVFALDNAVVAFR
jgi:hypothetical protein